MKTYELMLEVRRLAGVKAKNEQALSEADLQGKYRQAYERLCGSLKERQGELRARYKEAARQLMEVMEESVYAEPGKEDQQLHDEMVRRSQELGEDAMLVERLFLGFWEFTEGGRSNDKGRAEKG